MTVFSFSCTVKKKGIKFYVALNEAVLFNVFRTLFFEIGIECFFDSYEAEQFPRP